MATLPRSLRERRVFVDSSAYLALLDADDEHNGEAVATLDHLVAHRYTAYTTNVLLVEAHALILSALGMVPAARFLQRVPLGRSVVVRVRASDEEQAKAIIFRYTDKDFSFADAISFVVMQRLGMALAFTYDHHFAQYGFTIANPDTVA